MVVVVVVLRQGRLSTNGYGRHILCSRACVCACVRASGIPSGVWTLPFFLTTLDEFNLENLTHTGNRLRRAPPMLLDSLRQASRCLPPTLKGARVTITYPNRRGYFFGAVPRHHRYRTTSNAQLENSTLQGGFRDPSRYQLATSRKHASKIIQISFVEGGITMVHPAS